MLRIILPLRTVSEANAHEHWRDRQKRAANLRGAAALLCRSELGAAPVPPLRVRLTRIAPRDLDSDNLAGSQKHVRDGVADWLGIDDRDPRVEWTYAQRRPVTPGGWGTLVEIENLGPVVIAGRATAQCASEASRG